MACLAFCIYFSLVLSNASGLLSPMTKPNGDPDMVSIISHVTLMEHSMSILQTQVQTLTSNLHTTEDELKSSRDEITALKSELLTTKAQLKTTGDEVTRLKTELNQAEKEIKKPHPQNTTSTDTISNDVKSNTREVESLNAQVQSLKRDVNKNANDLKAVQTRQSLAEQVLAEAKASALGGLSKANKNAAAFLASQRKDTTLNGGETILTLDTVDYNTGNGYDQMSGIFRAPVAGTYIFWANLRFHKSSTLYVSLYKDQRLLTSGHSVSDKLFGSYVSMVAVAQLPKGDTIHFNVSSAFHQTSQMLGSSESAFGGTLLYS